MKPTPLFILFTVCCVMGWLAPGCDFWTKDNIIGPDHPDGNGADSTTVSYLSDVQPIFDAKCITCHGSQGGIALTSYSTLMAGGSSGAVVAPGNGANSLLIKRINGAIPPQMPIGASPLSTEEILLIKTWIDEGALDN